MSNSDFVRLACAILMCARLCPAQSRTIGQTILAQANPKQARRDYAKYVAQMQSVPPANWVSCAIADVDNECSYQEHRLILRNPVVLPPTIGFEVTKAPRPGELRITDPWPEVPIFVPEHSWVLAESTRDAEVLSALRELSKSGELFDCEVAASGSNVDDVLKPFRCSIVAATSIGQNRADVLADCKILKTATVASFPMGCTALAFSAGGETWLSAVTGISVTSRGPERVTERIKVVSLRPNLNISDYDLLRAVDGVLAAKPYSIQDRDLFGSQLAAESNRVYSRLIAGGWWIQSVVYASANSLELKIDCNLIVSKTNTNGTLDWHPATPAQEQEYCSGLRDQVARALERICGGPGSTVKDGTNRLSCK